MCSAVCCRRQCGTQMLQCAVYDNFGIRCTHTTTASQPNAMHIACTSDIHTLLLVVHKQCDGGVQNRSHRRIEKHAAHTCAHCYHLPSTYIVHTHKCIHIQRAGRMSDVPFIIHWEPLVRGEYTKKRRLEAIFCRFFPLAICSSSADTHRQCAIQSGRAHPIKSLCHFPLLDISRRVYFSAASANDLVQQQ